MSLEERNVVIGLALGVTAFIVYWAVVIARAATDGAPFTQVAWQGPMLWTLVIGGGFYALTYGVARWRLRGTRATDERDAQVLLHADSASGGLTGIAVLATLIMLTLDASPFWVAHVLFVGAFLGSVAGSGVAIAGYREGLAS